MYNKGKIVGMPCDLQSKEKLAMYVYEYLVHIGAQKTANSFLQEIRWDKSVSVGEPPGFLHSWWSVFWDLYNAAPERRDSHDHTNEAKAFHDYGFVNSEYPNGLPHEHCMPARHLSNTSFLHRGLQSGHTNPQGPIIGCNMSVGVGVQNIASSLGALGPDVGHMRQRPIFSAIPGSDSLGPQSLYPPLKFHQPGGGSSFCNIPGGFISGPQHIGPVGLSPGPSNHPMHGGPLSSHHFHASGGLVGQGGPSRPRWMAPQSSSGLPASANQLCHPIVCSGDIGSLPPAQTSTSGFASSPVIPLSPNNTGNHLVYANTLIDATNQSAQQHHPTPPQYAPLKQHPSPITSSLTPEQIYSTRSAGQIVFGAMEGAFCGGPLEGILNGSGLDQRSILMPPPPPDYSGGGGLSIASSPGTASYPGDIKMSPLHPNDMLVQGGLGIVLSGTDYISGSMMHSSLPASCSLIQRPSISSHRSANTPPQYMLSHQQLSAQHTGPRLPPCLAPVQFPQEYSFNPIPQ